MISGTWELRDRNTFKRGRNVVSAPRAPAGIASCGESVDRTAFQHIPRTYPDAVFAAQVHNVITGATEIMNSPRINPVVSKPVCTPVLPAGYGTAAGHARLAPPAFAPFKRTVHRLASGGTIAARLAARNKVKKMMRALAPKQRASNQIFRPNEILLAGPKRCSTASAPARAKGTGFPRAGGVRWTRLPSQSRPLPGANARKPGPIDCLASGTGCYSHTPPV